MNNPQFKIETYFPGQKSQTAQDFSNSIIAMMTHDDTLKCAGYFDEEDFRKDLIFHLDDRNIDQYHLPSSQRISSIKNTITSTIIKCHKALPHPDLPIFVFVYPWFPNKDSQKLFQGTTAFATYYTMHVFVDLNSCTEASLRQTIAHEWHHLVFYRFHNERQCSLLDHIIMEGFVEIFREEVLGGAPAPWSVALSEDESLRQLKSIEEMLNSTSMELYRSVFWGNKEYKRWTGYSIGYNIAKKFRKKILKLSWENIVATKSTNIFDSII